MKKLIYALSILLMSLTMASCEVAYAVSSVPSTEQVIEYDYVYDTTTDISVIITYGKPAYYNGSLLYYYYKGWYYYPYYYGNNWYFRPYSRPYRRGHIPYFDMPRRHDRRIDVGKYGFSKPNGRHNGLPIERNRTTYRYDNRPKSSFNSNHSSTRTNRTITMPQNSNRGGMIGGSRGNAIGVSRGAGRR